MNLEQDIQPNLDHNICARYWHVPSDHKVFEAEIKAIRLRLTLTIIRDILRG